MRVPVIGLISGLLIAGGISCAFAAEAADADRPAVPEGPIEMKGSKKTVIFSHQKGHEKIDCVVCHHEVDGKPTYAKCTDSGCHDNLKERKGINSLYFVVHNKSGELKHQSCMSCHVKTAAEQPDKKKLLTGCSGSWCHPQAKKEDKKEEADNSQAS